MLPNLFSLLPRLFYLFAVVCSVYLFAGLISQLAVLSSLFVSLFFLFVGLLICLLIRSIFLLVCPLSLLICYLYYPPPPITDLFLLNLLSLLLPPRTSVFYQPTRLLSYNTPGTMYFVHLPICFFPPPDIFSSFSNT